MKPVIYVHKYLMYSRSGLNSRSHTTEHEGALIRVEEGGVSGYGCLHPWVELGDTCLDELLKELAEGRISRQVKCALECADVDRGARALGQSLFAGLEVPKSHATIVGGVERVGESVDVGFDMVKLKMGRDMGSNIRLLKDIGNEFPELGVRLDFNGVSEQGALEQMLAEIGDEMRGKIDFIEDPLPLGSSAWDMLRDKYGMKLGVDRGIAGASGEFDISVIKPAMNDVEKLCDAAQMKGRSVVITSYMDHPIGQTYAAYCAGVMNSKYLGLINERCGLMTHGLYRPTEFTEAMGATAPTWNLESAAMGSGLGFDDLLEQIDWMRI